MKTFRESEQRALRELLADDDPQVLSLLGEQFASMGEAGCEFLEGVCVGSNLAARRGAQRILDGLRESRSRQAFEEFCDRPAEDCDLEEGCWRLARTRYWHLDVDRYRARLDEMAREFKGRLTGRETPRSAIEVGNHYLFRLLGFRGNTQDYYDPDNSYLNRVLDRRLGIPISLSIVYLLLGRRLHLPLFGVNLPGHFLIKWQSPDVEFFIDPFHLGQLLTAAECCAMAERLGARVSRAGLTSVSDRVVLARLCRNLRALYAVDDPVRAAWLESCVERLTRR